jgi:uncharacterized membrane protein
MTFVDSLTLVLDLLILVCATIFYTGFFVWYNTRKGDIPRAQAALKEGAYLLVLLGGLAGIIAIWGEETFPLAFGANTSYNPYFFDPLTLVAFLSVAFGLAILVKMPTHFVGMLSVVCGVGVMYYGIRADYFLGLTLDPLETLLLYLGFGAMAILAYPVTLYVDWFVTGPTNPSVTPLPSAPRPSSPRMWTVLIGMFLLWVALAGSAAAAYGLDAAWGHL